MALPPFRAAGFKDIEMYISRCKNVVEQYIATCPILDLFVDTGRRLGSGSPKRWW